MKLSEISPSVVSLTTTFSASLCCVLPMTIVFLGLGSGAFMMTTMKYQPILYPLGLLGLGVSYYLFFRKKKQCDAQSCKMQNKKLNLTMLALSTAMMGIITYVDFFLVSI